jgi:hypothetical protein
VSQCSPEGERYKNILGFEWIGFRFACASIFHHKFDHKKWGESGS